MNDFSRHIFIGKGVSLKAQLLLIGIIGVVVVGVASQSLFYEEGTDVYFKLISKGFYTGQPDVYHNDGVLRYHAYLFKFLYEYVPSIEWYDVMSLVNLFVTGCLFLYTLVLIVREKREWSFIPLTFLSVLFMSNILVIQITRLSILISGLSLIILSLLIVSGRLSRKSLIGFSSLAMYGALLRIDSVILAGFSMTVAFYLLFKKSQVSVLSEVRPFNTIALSLLGVFVILISSYSLPFNGVDKAYDAIRPFTYTLWDFERNVSSNELNDKDIEILTAVKRKFLDDETVINEAFFKRTGIVSLDKNPSSLPSYVSQIKPTILRFLVEFSSLKNRFFVPLIILILAPILLFKFSYSLAILQFWFISVFMTIVVFLKPEVRVLSPLVLLFLCLELIILESRKEHLELRLLSMLVLIGYFLHFDYSIYSYNRTRHLRSSKMLSRIVNLRETKIVTTLNVGEYFDSKLSIKRSRLFDSYSVHNGLAYLYPSYKNRMHHLTNGLNFLEYMRYFSNCQNCVFFSSADRIETVENYMKDVHGLSCSFTNISNEFQITMSDGFGFFKLETYEKP